MSKPTPHATLYAWHRNALLGVLGDEGGPHIGEEPQCGWFERRLVKDGPWVPARIWMEQDVDEETGELASDEVMQCEVAGERRDPVLEWSWLNGHPISEAKFRYMTARQAYAAEHAPDEPAANPREPVDWLKVPTPEFGKR